MTAAPGYRALFSLHDPEVGIAPARLLTALGWEVVASRETASVLRQTGLSVRFLEDYLGASFDLPFPPTLHPRMEAALTLADHPEPIHLVLVMPYPRDVGNDVGGRTLLALAAKGGRIPVMDREGLARVTAALEETGQVGEALQRQLAARVHQAIAGHFAGLAREGDRFETLQGQFHALLLNGENPYQVPAAHFRGETDDPLALHRFERVSGEDPCFTNLADADCILHTMSLLAEGFRRNFGRVPHLAVAAKHGNPCGAAFHWDDPGTVLEQTLFGNPRAVWGGEMITNFPIVGALGMALARSARREVLLGQAGWMLDLVMAPGFDGAAVEALGRRERRKLLANPALEHPGLSGAALFAHRMVRGGFLRQPPPHYVLDLAETDGAGAMPDDPLVRGGLILAWAVAFSSSHGGNEVALVAADHLAGVGGGPSTVEAVATAIDRSRANGHDLRGAVFGADAFFPFEDAPRLLIESGCAWGVVPGGGVRFAEVRQCFADRGVGVGYLPEWCRGFCRH
ncbi:MAG: hypothetical protein HQL82_06160 [Magnetococcales bacterium]|nr:hypothetical protein [Magnetococcales bacterium]